MTSFMEFMYSVNCHKRKIILFQCQDGARGGGDRPPCPPCSYATVQNYISKCLRDIPTYSEHLLVAFPDIERHWKLNYPKECQEIKCPLIQSVLCASGEITSCSLDSQITIQ